MPCSADSPRAGSTLNATGTAVPIRLSPPEGLVGQRRLASLGAGALHAARRQVELPGRQHLDPESVLEGAREPVEGDPAAHG